MRKYIFIIISLFMTFLMCGRVQAQDSEVQTITGFEEISYEDRFIYPDTRESEDELNRYMPDYVNAYIEGEKGKTGIPVRWKCVITDYESTDYYCYQFSPVWDESKYRLSEGIDLYTDAPYLFVCFGEKISDSGILSRASENGDKNAKKIMNYLTGTMGLSTTAACGIVANIYYESGCVADILEIGYTWESGGGYGICQWTNYPRTSATGRRTSLVSFCTRLGYDYKSLSGQLKYLEYELTTGYYPVLNSLKDINVTAKPEQDAYNAAYIWCTKFEIPANAQNVAVIRGNFAKTLWKDYSAASTKTAAPKLTSYSYPDTLVKGKGYPVKGMIESSPTKITKVKVSLVDSSGKTVCSKSAAPKATSYNIGLLDAYITFDKLSAGLHYYKIEATNSGGTYTLLNKDFVVSDTKPAITGYNYPVNIVKGKDFLVSGKINCSSYIKSVTIGIYKSKTSSAFRYGSKIAVNAASFDVSNFNQILEFNKLSAGTYYYRIVADTADGSYTLVNKSFLVSPSKIAKVTGLVQSSKSATSVTFSWKKIAGVTGYKIVRSDSPNGTYKKQAMIKGYSNIQYKNSGIASGRQYYYKVCAYITRDGKTTYGPYSTMTVARTKSYSPAVYKQIKANTTMYSEAGTAYSKIRTVRKGVSVRLLNFALDKDGKKWFYVKYGGRYGYIRAGMVK